MYPGLKYVQYLLQEIFIISVLEEMKMALVVTVDRGYVLCNRKVINTKY